jgi:DnaK suppressor protein
LPARQNPRKPVGAKNGKAAENARKTVARLARDAAAVANGAARANARAPAGRSMLAGSDVAAEASGSTQGSAFMVTPGKRGASAKRDSGKMNGKTSGKSGSTAAPKARSDSKVAASIPAGGRSGLDKAQGPEAAPGSAPSGEAGVSRIVVLPTGYRPSDSEPFMNERQRLYFRNKLIAWKEEIVRLNRETLVGLHEDSAQHADVADRATFETDRALELRARDRQRKLISKIDAALARIEDGSYGYCEETGEPIGLKRLDARPIATLSIEAQERHERRERVFREE